jgi:hypothetical protein
LKMSANYFPKFEFFLPPRVGDVSKKAKEILLFAFLAWEICLAWETALVIQFHVHFFFLMDL